MPEHSHSCSTEEHAPLFVEEFYDRLLLKYGAHYLNKARDDLLGPGTSDKDWREYCFSSESPF